MGKKTTDDFLNKVPMAQDKRDEIGRSRLIDEIEREVISGLLKFRGYLGQENTFALAKQGGETWRRRIDDHYANRSGALCTVPGCHRFGAISRSSRHEEDSDAKWYCREHYEEKKEPNPDSAVDVATEIAKLLRAVGKRIQA